MRATHGSCILPRCSYFPRMSTVPLPCKGAIACALSSLILLLTPCCSGMVREADPQDSLLCDSCTLFSSCFVLYWRVVVVTCNYRINKKEKRGKGFIYICYLFLSFFIFSSLKLPNGVCKRFERSTATHCCIFHAFGGLESQKMRWQEVVSVLAENVKVG